MPERKIEFGVKKMTVLCRSGERGMIVMHGISETEEESIRMSIMMQERKKKREGEKVPLTMSVNLFEDNDDAQIKQVRQLHERISKLALVDRALVMLWLEGMSYDEIGAIVGITAQNVGVKLFRIKEQLKKM